MLGCLNWDGNFLRGALYHQFELLFRYCLCVICNFVKGYQEPLFNFLIMKELLWDQSKEAEALLNWNRILVLYILIIFCCFLDLVWFLTRINHQKLIKIQIFRIMGLFFPISFRKNLYIICVFLLFCLVFLHFFLGFLVFL